MRLRGWNVEGFGLLHDFRVDGLPDGLTVVFGPNEAGKTSLLAFIRGVLFGYPDRRKKDRPYPPLRGGRHGGRLFVESSGSTWIVERFASPGLLSITQPDGSLGTEADLRRLLGGVDAELHRNVFAFSLSELQEFESLQVEGVRDRIFAAGVVGAGRSARTAIDALAAQRAEIGKRRGDSRINGLRTRLNELEEMLRQAKARAAKYPERRRAADDLDEAQKRIGRELADARHEMARLDALLAAWPDWDESVQSEGELSTLADTPDVPDDLAMRLDSALVETRTQSARHQERQQTVLDLEGQLEAIVLDDRLSAVSAEMKQLGHQIGSVRARRERLGKLRTDCDSLRKRVEEEAPRLGAGWTSKTVREFDASIPAAQDIAEWGERLRAAEQSVQEAQDESARLASSAQECADETSRRAEALRVAVPLPEAHDLGQRDAAVRRLRAMLADLVGLRADLQAATQRVNEAARRAKEAHDTAAAKESELQERGAALRSAPEPPSLEDLARRERAIRELRTGLADLAAARADLRAANQRAVDAKQRADEADLSASVEEAELERRARALAEARPVPEAENLAALERAARELRSRLVDLAVLRSDLRSAETRLADRRLDAERRSAPVPTSNLRRPLLATAALLCILGVVLMLVSQFVAAGVAFAIAVAAALLALRALVASAAAPIDSSIDIAEAARGVKELASRVENLESTAKPLATRLGFSSLPKQVELEAKADEIAAHSRARQDRDRDAAAVEDIRAQAHRKRGVAQHLRMTVREAQDEVDNGIAQHVLDVEAANLITAKRLGFAELPSNSPLEEKAAEVTGLVGKRRERDLETSAVQALEQGARRARDTVTRLEEELSGLRTEVEATEATRVRAGEKAALGVALSLGLATVPAPVDLEVTAQEVDNLIRARRDRDRETAAVEELRGRTEAAATSARTASATVTAYRNDRDALHRAWSAWKAAHRCPEALRPETAQQFFASVAQLRENVVRLDDMEADTRGIAAEMQEFSRAVHSLIDQAGISNAPVTPQAEDALEGLRERVEADARLRAERSRLASELEKARRARANSEDAAIAAASALQSVLAEAGALDEGDCRARIRNSQRRADLKKTVRDAQHRLRTRLGIGAQADAVRAELVSGDRQGWEARKQGCKATLARLQPAHEEGLRRHQAALEELSSLERECDVVTHAAEREGVIAEIREALSEWRRLAIAQSLVQRTLRRYELERQPAVLLRAATSFSRITDGRYTRLTTREDGIDVITANGGRLDAAELSRGAAEQLYLCLRLALAEEFGRLAVPLPLVMDDVLVNFDPERARPAAQMLLAATPAHQILLFTCHPETVDLLIDLAPSIKVVEISRQTPIVRPVEAPSPEGGRTISTSLPTRSARETASLSGPELADAVLSSIRAAGRPLSRAEILVSTGMLEMHWTAVIQELRSRGLVISHGRKRGTTWGLAE